MATMATAFVLVMMPTVVPMMMLVLMEAWLGSWLGPWRRLRIRWRIRWWVYYSLLKLKGSYVAATPLRPTNSSLVCSDGCAAAVCA